jgi:hypothetical protein
MLPIAHAGIPREPISVCERFLGLSAIAFQVSQFRTPSQIERKGAQNSVGDSKNNSVPTVLNANCPIHMVRVCFGEMSVVVCFDQRAM